MKKFLLLLTAAFIFGCTAPEDKALATAAGTKITQGQFDKEMAMLQKAMQSENYELPEEQKEAFDAQLLNSMIIKVVYEKEMDKLGIEVDQAELDEQYAKLVANYESEEKLIEDIEAKGFSLEKVKNEFQYQQRLNGLKAYAEENAPEVSEEENLAFYEENKEKYFVTPPTVNSARHILITTEELGEEGALAKITEIREEILAGKDFAEAAGEYSMGPSSANGGQLGAFQKGQMVPEFEEVAFSLPLDEVSEPVLTQFGYHLILVEDRVDSSYVSYDDVKEQISDNLKLENFFAKIEEDANIKKPDWAIVD